MIYTISNSSMQKNQFHLIFKFRNKNFYHHQFKFILGEKDKHHKFFTTNFSSIKEDCCICMYAYIVLYSYYLYVCIQHILYCANFMVTHCVWVIYVAHTPARQNHLYAAVCEFENFAQLSSLSLGEEILKIKLLLKF